jgi:hypothetical protein
MHQYETALQMSDVNTSHAKVCINPTYLERSPEVLIMHDDNDGNYLTEQSLLLENVYQFSAC